VVVLHEPDQDFQALQGFFTDVMFDLFGLFQDHGGYTDQSQKPLQDLVPAEQVTAKGKPLRGKFNNPVFFIIKVTQLRELLHHFTGGRRLDMPFALAARSNFLAYGDARIKEVLL
jgi:hypothetical protein